jgi:hypothetical protein
MAPVSVLPGRVRYESMLLIGRESICKRLEKQLLGLEGVISASANHRSGRLLVTFDAKCVSDTTLAERIENELRQVGLQAKRAFDQRKRSRSAEFSPQLAGHLMLDVVAHIFLPKPLQLLLPVALAAFKGGLLQAPQGATQQP